MHHLVVRFGFALAFLLVGYDAVVHCLAASLAVEDPAAALAISSGNARALGERAERILSADNTPRERNRAEVLARRAVLLDPTVVSAIVTIALKSSIEGRSDRAGPILAYSEALSRRDLVAQIYFIEDAVTRGDVASALHHYDIALRTSGAAAAMLFPVLRNAISETPLRQQLAATLSKKPIWGASFLAEASLQGPDFHAVALLFADLRRRGFAPADDAEKSLMASLITNGDVPTAWHYYTIVHPDAANTLIRNGKFDDRSPEGSAFDWALGSGEGMLASMGSAGGKGSLQFSTASTTAGIIAFQLLTLDSGGYTLRSTARGIAQPAGTGPYWQLTCVDGRIAGTMDLGSTGPGNREFTQTVAVPAGCPIQWLRLHARPTDNIQGTTGEIAAISLSRR